MHTDSYTNTYIHTYMRRLGENRLINMERGEQAEVCEMGGREGWGMKKGRRGKRRLWRWIGGESKFRAFQRSVRGVWKVSL